MAGYIGSKASVVTPGAERKKVFSITTTTTSLTGLVYTPGFVHVYHNGVRLVDGTDYTATNGTSITLTTAAQNGDEVVVISYATFQTSDTVSASAGGTFSNAVTIDANGATVLTVDRATSDGTIIDLQKDGSSVGSVGAATASGVTSIYAGNDDTALWFRNGIDAVTPFSITGNSTRDAAIDFGQAGGRFKDLYLSGGVYLGGTGAANYLDDYEEGSWTPTIDSGGTIAGGGGYYRKIGSLVVVWCSYSVSTISGSGTFTIGGLPFTASNNFGSQGAVRNQGVNGAGGNVLVVEALGGTTTARFHYPSSTSTQLTVQVADVTGGDFNAWTLMYDT